MGYWYTSFDPYTFLWKSFQRSWNIQETSGTTRRLHPDSILWGTNGDEKPLWRHTNPIWIYKNREREKRTPRLCHVANALDSSIFRLQWAYCTTLRGTLFIETQYATFYLCMSIKKYLHRSYEKSHQGMNFWGHHRASLGSPRCEDASGVWGSGNSIVKAQYINYE